MIVCTPQDWRDIREWYTDDDHDDELPVCEMCEEELDEGLDPIELGLCKTCAEED